MSPDVHFEITPDVSLADEPIHVQLCGLAPKQTVTIRTRRLSTNPAFDLESYGIFRVNEHGIIDLHTDAPLQGTYSGVDGMGLFWSMQRIPRTDTQRLGGHGPLAPLVYTLSAESHGRVLAKTTVERQWCSTSVQRTPVREGGLVGTYFHHGDERARPGIIVLGGSEGGLSEYHAALLASHGYTTLALAYFGMEHLPSELVNIPLEYIESAIEWFGAKPSVLPDWLGVHGTSKGGELALLASTRFPQIRAVVCVSSGGVVFHGIQTNSSSKLPASWTWGGEPIPYASEDHPYRSGKLAPPSSREIMYRPWYDAHLYDEDTLRRATIPVEKIQGSVFLISGRDDQMIDSERISQICMQRLRDANHPYRYQHVVYPEAGHSIWIPYLLSSTSREDPISGNVWKFGGTLASNAYASRDSWRRILEFFADESGSKM